MLKEIVNWVYEKFVISKIRNKKYSQIKILISKSNIKHIIHDLP